MKIKPGTFEVFPKANIQGHIRIIRMRFQVEVFSHLISHDKSMERLELEISTQTL